MRAVQVEREKSTKSRAFYMCSRLLPQARSEYPGLARIPIDSHRDPRPSACGRGYTSLAIHGSASLPSFAVQAAARGGVQLAINRSAFP